LGHTAPGLLKTLKNTASRGLFVPLPHPQLARCEKALGKLFPGCSFRLYRNREALLDALKPSGAVPPGGPVPQYPALWRPFWEEGAPLAFKDAPPVFVPVLPLPWMNAPEVLVFKAGAEEAAVDFVSPLFLAGLSRAAYELIAASQSRPPLNQKYRRDFPLWKRQSIYLFFSGNADMYESLFARFLDRGFLLPPDPALPAILVPGLSPGEETSLISLLSFTP
jgi:hypothetical protein